MKTPEELRRKFEERKREHNERQDYNSYERGGYEARVVLQRTRRGCTSARIEYTLPDPNKPAFIVDTKEEVQRKEDKGIFSSQWAESQKELRRRAWHKAKHTIDTWCEEDD